MSKSALERENQNLRSEITRLKNTHRQTSHAKNKEIDRLAAMTPAGLKTLFAQYENLEPLLKLLVRVADLADPTQAARYDNDRVTTSNNVGAHPIEGEDTKTDRDRLDWISDQISRLTRQLEVDLRAREHKPASTGLTGGPQCWKRQCEGRGLKQSWDNDACGYCGEPFSTYASVVREMAGG